MSCMIWRAEPYFYFVFCFLLFCSELPGQQMNLVLMKSLDALEDCCFDSSLEYKWVCYITDYILFYFGLHFFFIQTSIPKFCGEEYRDKIRRLLFLCTFIESWTYAGWQGPWEVHIIPKFSYQVRLQYSKTVRVWSSQSGAGLTCLGHSSMAEPSRQGKSFSLTPVWASRVAAHATASHPPNTQHV